LSDSASTIDMQYHFEYTVVSYDFGDHRIGDRRLHGYLQTVGYMKPSNHKVSHQGQDRDSLHEDPMAKNQSLPRIQGMYGEIHIASLSC
jgi:hypothetical protein